MRFVRSPPQAFDKEVRLSGDLSELYIGDESFTTGDLCTVFSVLSQVSWPVSENKVPYFLRMIYLVCFVFPFIFSGKHLWHHHGAVAQGCGGAHGHGLSVHGAGGADPHGPRGAEPGQGHRRQRRGLQGRSGHAGRSRQVLPPGRVSGSASECGSERHL